MTAGARTGRAATASGAAIRAEVGHPIIDVDGHVLEILDATHDHLRAALGPQRFQAWLERGSGARVSQRPLPMDRTRSGPSRSAKDRGTS